MAGRRRYISTEISTDKKIVKLGQMAGDFGVLLYTWMVPHADDEGSISADYDEIRMKVVPGLSKTAEDVGNAVSVMLELGLLELDESNEMLLFPCERFYKYQSYIKPVNRRKTPGISEERQTSAQNAVSPSLPVPHSPSVPHPVPHTHSDPPRAFVPNLEPPFPDDPGFVGEFVRNWERVHGLHPGASKVSDAAQLERDFGYDACVQVCRDTGWEKPPAWLRPKLEQRARAPVGAGTSTTLGPRPKSLLYED